MEIDNCKKYTWTQRAQNILSRIAFLDKIWPFLPFRAEDGRAQTQGISFGKKRVYQTWRYSSHPENYQGSQGTRATFLLLKPFQHDLTPKKTRVAQSVLNLWQSTKKRLDRLEFLWKFENIQLLVYGRFRRSQKRKSWVRLPIPS